MNWYALWINTRREEQAALELESAIARIKEPVENHEGKMVPREAEAWAPSRKVKVWNMTCVPPPATVGQQHDVGSFLTLR